MKRTVGETAFVDSLAMANCLISLSRGPDVDQPPDSSPNRVFECKTCNRQFPSFQALGGHRASHKKPRLNHPDQDHDNSGPGSPAKPKTHECSVCGLEFTVGQALGGHMRRHRVVVNDYHHDQQPGDAALTTALSLFPTLPLSKAARQAAPVMKKSIGRRVLCLDLNLTPFENDLEFRLGKTSAPMVDCFL